MVGGEIACSFTGGDYLEATASCPFDKFDGQGGLIAIGHGVGDTGLCSLVCQQHTAKYIGFNIDHDDMRSMLDRKTCVS